MRIVTVCTMGIGTSILLKMNVETALERLGIAGTVEASDLGSARGAAAGADAIITNAEMARMLTDVGVPVYVVANFMDVEAISDVIRQIQSARA